MHARTFVRLSRHRPFARQLLRSVGAAIWTEMTGFDASTLDGKYHLVKLSVLSSTQISSRTSAVLSNLQQDKQDTDDALATVVALTANARVGSKLVTIAEIAKRELATKGVKCYQYNALSSRMIEIERQPKSKDGEGDGDEDESEDAFETMGVGELSAMKKRKVPVMTIYLSTSSVRELKVAFGEQT